MKRFLIGLIAIIFTEFSYSQENSSEAVYTYNYVDLSEVQEDIVIVKRVDFKYIRELFILPKGKVKSKLCYIELGGEDFKKFKIVPNEGHYIYSFGSKDYKRVSVHKNPFEFAKYPLKNSYSYDVILYCPTDKKDKIVFKKTIVYQRISRKEMTFRNYYAGFYKKKYKDDEAFKELLKDTIDFDISIDKILRVYQFYYNGDIVNFSFSNDVKIDKTHYVVIGGEDSFNFGGASENNVLKIFKKAIIFNGLDKKFYKFTVNLYEMIENKEDKLVSTKNIIIKLIGEAE